MEAETVELSRSLYDAEAVRVAAAYGALGAIVVEEGPHQLRLTLTAPRRPDLMDHLLNHALFETVKRSRAGVAP